MKTLSKLALLLVAAFSALFLSTCERARGRC